MIRWVIVVAGVLFVAANVWMITEIHEARQRYEATCREALTKELRWSPRAAALPLPADPCEAVRMVRRGR
jgi:hypothetical protein